MDIRFWGVRGSIATPLSNTELRQKLTAAVEQAVLAGIKHIHEVPAFIDQLSWTVRKTTGGNTSCIQIQAGNTCIILDAGTGIRQLGYHLCQINKKFPVTAHILLSHTHWDHISGIPFFVPVFRPDSQLTVYVPETKMEESLRKQQLFEFFPVPLSPHYRFEYLENKSSFSIDDVEINIMPLNHPGGSYGYRITYQDKIVIYASDSEYKDLTVQALKPFTDFFSNADLLIFDAQYSISENIEKEDWGHSNILTGIDMALASGVKNMAFTHHDPVSKDEELIDVLSKAREYIKISQPEVDFNLFLAYEGLTIKL